MPRSRMMPAAILMALMPAAQAATDEALAACRSLKDSAARLACYDGLPLSSARAAPAAQGPASPAPAVQGFGLPATARPAPIESIESRIEGHFAGWYPGTRIRLSNGQVWQVTDGTSRFADVDSPRVVVRRGALGSFFLDIDGVNPAPRVRRVE